MSGLGDVELILERADTPVSLQEETAPRTTVVPLLGGKKGHFCLSALFKKFCLLEIKMHGFIIVEEEKKTSYTHVRPVGGRSVTPFLLAVSFPAGRDIKKIEIHLTLINTAISGSGQHTLKTIKRLLRQYL